MESHLKSITIFKNVCTSYTDTHTHTPTYVRFSGVILCVLLLDVIIHVLYKGRTLYHSVPSVCAVNVPMQTYYSYSFSYDFLPFKILFLIIKLNSNLFPKPKV